MLCLLHVQLSTWTPIKSDFTAISTDPSYTEVKIDLQSVGVPDTAKMVLVNAEVETGDCNKQSNGRVLIYTNPEYKFQLIVHSYGQQAWAYNSESMWLPYDGKYVTGLYDGAAFGGNLKMRFRVIGYK